MGGLAVNQELADLVKESGLSRKEFARRVNDTAHASGEAASYTHTSVAGWIRRGVNPRSEIVPFVAAVLGDALGRTVTVEEMGLGASPQASRAPGWDFPRDPTTAVQEIVQDWSSVDRRKLLSTGSAFAAGAFQAPVMRWMAVPADAETPRLPGRRVGREDITTLWNAAALARRQDSKYGGGDWRTGAVARCLKLQAAPMLHGSYSEAVGRQLFSAAAELSRAVGWSAVDMGHHRAAQAHLTRALRLARMAGDVQSGCYVLSTMALQTFLAGHPETAADMAEGAYELARHTAAPRVLAFAKLAEARAHGRAGHARDAGVALHRAETLLGQAQTENDPDWLGYFTHARLASDAIEIHRDLAQPAAALRWNLQAEAMPQDRYTRAVGIRTTVLGTAHLQAADLDQGLAVGHRAIDVLATVKSTRARSYMEALVTAAARWKRHPAVAELADRAHREIGTSRPA